jgi:hypothetical protein
MSATPKRLRPAADARAWLEWWATAVAVVAELSQTAEELLGAEVERPSGQPGEGDIAGVIGRVDLAAVLAALVKLSERLAHARPRLRLVEPPAE